MRAVGVSFLILIANQVCVGQTPGREWSSWNRAGATVIETRVKCEYSTQGDSQWAYQFRNIGNSTVEFVEREQYGVPNAPFNKFGAPGMYTIAAAETSPMFETNIHGTCAEIQNLKVEFICVVARGEDRSCFNNADGSPVRAKLIERPASVKSVEWNDRPGSGSGMTTGGTDTGMQSGRQSSVPSTNTSSKTGSPMGAHNCRWPSDFSLIRDPEMLNDLKNSDFAQKLSLGGQPVQQQISAGEAALSQIAGSLPSIESTIRSISEPTVTHYNFRFDYVQTCKQNTDKSALLAAECQHVNVENALYALNGTLQIVECLSGLSIRPDLGANRDTSMPQDELPGAVNSARVVASPDQRPCSNSDVKTSGDLRDTTPECQPPAQPNSGAKITH